MKIIFASYREWANKIAAGLRSDGHEVLHIENKEGLTLTAAERFKPDLFFVAGWSWYIPKELYEKYEIIGLHPSPLPKYRGGSPLQNQIIAGEKTSAVSLFKITEKFDEGPLYGHEEFSLEGHLGEIYARITQIGLKLYRKLAKDYPNLKSWMQDDSQATLVKRRTPEQSELKPQDFSKKSAREIYDFCRALEDPYPNAFIVCADGKKILIKRVELE